MSKPAQPAAVATKPSMGDRLRAIRNMPQWVSAHRIKAAVAFSVVFSLLGAVLFTWALLEAKRQLAEKEAAYTAADALAALDAHDMPEALHIAKLVKLHDNVTSNDAGGPAFVFGYSAFERAENPYDINRHHGFKIAAYWLDEAIRLGVPDDRLPQAMLLSGKALTMADRYVDALPVLREAVLLNPDHVGDLSRYLARAYSRQPDPDFPAALASILRYREWDDKNASNRLDGLLLHAEILTRLGRSAEAQTVLADIPADSKRRSEAIVLGALGSLIAAEQLRDRVDPPATPVEVDAQYAAANKLVAEAAEIDRGRTLATAQASYVAGLIALAQGRDAEAADHFHQTYRRSVDGTEGLAAQLYSADLARKSNRDDAAVALYRAVLEATVAAERYHNPWLPLTELKKRFVAAYEDFLGRRNYSASSTLAEHFPKVFEENYAVQLAAESNVAWAKKLADEALNAGGHNAHEQADESRRHYRTAGKLYERLAELRLATKAYPEELWASAENYLRGADYDKASQQFRKYLEVEPRGRHAEAMIGLAEVLLVKQRHEQSLALLKQCLDLHPRDPSQFRARLLLAELYAELNQWEPAERVLYENLESDALTPESEEWRRSLFTLGRMLYDVGRYEDASIRLDEAVERYPNDVETIDARYRAAEAHRRVAQQIELEIPVDALPAERAKFTHRAGEEYHAALQRFDETIRVARGPHLRGLEDEVRGSLLRNSLFARGSILHAMSRYDDAIRAHQTAIASFPNSPAALDAYLQIVDCYRRMQRGPEARGTLEQAKLMLNRLPQDASFESVSNYSRQEWAKLLDTLGSL